MNFFKALHRRQLDWLMFAAVCSAACSAMELLVLRETGISSLLRPAPGVMFITTLCLGWRGALASIAGIALGYMLSVQTGWPVVFKAVVDPIASAGIIAGIGLQALFQVWLLRRFEGIAGRRVHRLIGIVVVAPLGCLVSPTITTLLLDWQNAIHHLTPLHFWLVACVGSMLGVTVIYPLAWLLDRGIASEGASPPQAGLILAITSMVIGSWVVTYELLSSSINLERSSLSSRFRDTGEALSDQANDIDLMGISMQALFRQRDVDPQVLDDLVAELGSKTSTVAGLALVEPLSAAQQSAYEKQASERAGAPIRVRVYAPDGHTRPVRLEQPEMLIEQVAPQALARNLLGLVVGGDADLQRVLADASQRSRARLSAPLDMLLNAGGDRLAAWVIPLRRAADQSPGFLLLLQRPADLVRSALEHSAPLPNAAWVQLSDVSGAVPVRLFTGDQDGSELLIHDSQELPENEVRSRQQLMIGGRVWELLMALPTAAAFQFSTDWWVVQVIVQLLGAALASVLVVSVDRRRTMREMERQVSVLSRRYLNFERALASQPTPSAMTAARMQAPVNSRDALMLKAFDNGAFRQFYEPVISLSTGDIVGFESLLRWPEAPFPVAIPEIIAWAERTHHVHQLTLGAMRQAIEMVELWKSAASDRPSPWISINVSPDDVADVDFMEQLMDLFKRHPLARRQIKLEITEGVLVRDFKGVAQRLRWVRDQGMGISLDDFGTGYSSLSYLHQLPVDSIKIDRSFIASLDTDPRVREIVLATVELAHRLKLDIVAEGVEEPATAAYLHSIGCQAVQGWLFSKAQPSTVVDEWIRTERRFEYAA
ncbi:EAL domain-containing protein [Hydrocarboniphaga sp.]|uniref:EAL domain-containing protein n=1 Tax=Hydrocarboniphaga sp. TaxID=2033016 RepID=UPI003D10E56C